MRNLFSWRLPPSEADFSTLWETATFVFDTNFLLDLYRVSRHTVEDFLKILKHLQDRIWLPYQVADEFLRLREEVIDSEAASFKKALSALDKWKSDQQKFNSLRGSFSQVGRIVAAEVEYLFDEQKNYLDAVGEVEKAFREKINELANAHSSFDADNDTILENILSIFDAKVGEPYDEQSLQSLYKEAEDRYKKLQPPGFIDVKEKEDERKYGDFILWKQILTFAERESLPIVFVTGEKKPDWWIKKNRRIVAPHIELRREFQRYVKQPFWMYQTQSFIEMAKEKLRLEIDPRSIEETNAIADAELVDEQDDEAIKQAMEQIQRTDYSAFQKAMEQIQRPDYSVFQKAMEQIQRPDYSVFQKAMEQIQRTDYSAFQKAMEQTQIPDHSALQKAMEQIQRTDHSALQKAMEQIQRPDYSVFQKAMEQIQRPDYSAFQKAMEQTQIPDHSALQKAMEQIQRTDHSALQKAMEQIQRPDYSALQKAMEQIQRPDSQI